jgi:tetratricopeptide (TPR) repeat protein
MAEEEITELHEEDTTDEVQESENEEGLEPLKNNKKLIIIGASVAVLLLIILFGIALQDDDDALDDYTFSENLDESLNRKKAIPASELELMIKKANLLYTQGNKKEALHLFKQIATHSESISYYNLGVARMKNDQYDIAMDAFKKAIAQNDKICVSAINAAVCALKLGQDDRHKYYIDLAASSLQNEHNSPLYSYYKSLIEFYRNRPLEALSSLEHKSSDYFIEEQNYLRAKASFALNDSVQSASYLEQVINDDDLASLGMLYARTGNLDLAKKMLLKAIDGGYAPIKNSLALGHIYLKSGLIQEASQVYKTLYDSNLKNYTTIYPIKVSLNPEQFDLKKAQVDYLNHNYYTDSQNLEVLLHFAPFKIFDAMSTLSYIKKGSANIYIDDISSAKQYLSKAGHFSKVNKVIASAINDAINYKLHSALEKLLKISKSFPKHAILNYNLALTYAKLGNLKEANYYFSKSYNLDAKNYLAGIFAIMSGKLIGKVVPKQTQLFKENLGKEIETANIAFVKALLSFHDKNFPGVVQWSEEQKLNSAAENALMLLTAQSIKRDKLSMSYAKKLVELQPKNVLAQLLYIHDNFRKLPEKDFAIETLKYVKKLKLSLNDIFYGSHITLKFFIDYTFVTGHLFDLSEKIKKQLAVETQNTIGLLQAQAYTKVYLTQFEEAYVLYNQLIDEYKQRDSITLFNAALAATGSDHHGNAIALLELANLKNRFNQESRYALGILYLENKNYNAAATQFSKVIVKDFISKHFTFDIDLKSINSDVIVVE